MRFYDADLGRSLREQSNLAEDILTALADGDVDVYLHSLVDAHGSVVGAEALVRSIYGMASQFGLKTVVEGLETQAQLILISSFTDTQYQGYFLPGPYL